MNLTDVIRHDPTQHDDLLELLRQATLLDPAQRAELLHEANRLAARTRKETT